MNAIPTVRMKIATVRAISGNRARSPIAKALFRVISCTLSLNCKGTACRALVYLLMQLVTATVCSVSAPFHPILSRGAPQPARKHFQCGYPIRRGSDLIRKLRASNSNLFNLVHCWPQTATASRGSGTGHEVDCRRVRGRLAPNGGQQIRVKWG